jgi:hypothetical protein
MDTHMLTHSTRGVIHDAQSYKHQPEHHMRPDTLFITPITSTRDEGCGAFCSRLLSHIASAEDIKTQA